MEIKLRGYLKQGLIVDLAKEDLSYTVLAQKYSVTTTAIHNFKQRNLEEITSAKEAIAAGIREEAIGLWVADKKNRLAVYKRHLEILDEQIEAGMDPVDVRGALKVQQAALHNIAEELGDLQVRVDQGGQVRLVIEGVSEEDLK